MADHHDLVRAVGQRDELVGLLHGNAAGLLEKEMLAAFDDFPGPLEMGEVGRRDNDGVEVGLDQLALVVEDFGVGRVLERLLDVVLIAAADGDGLGALAALVVNEVDMAAPHRANPQKSAFEFHD